MSGKNIDIIAQLEGLSEWKVVALHSPEEDYEGSVLLQSVNCPEIGIWTYLVGHSTRTQIVLPNRKILTVVCVCSDCLPNVATATCFIHENARKLRMTQILTRYDNPETMMCEASRQTSRLFGWDYDDNGALAATSLSSANTTPNRIILELRTSRPIRKCRNERARSCYLLRISIPLEFSKI